MLLFLAIPAFSQPEEDALLARDFDVVLQKLQLMHYLDQVGMEYWAMPNNEVRTTSDETFPYYFSSKIIKNNPVPSIDIKEYLGFNFKEFVPITWKDFLYAVYNKNMLSLIELTDKYGFLSADRLKKHTADEKMYGNVIFAVRTNKYDKQLKKMLKSEYKLGNISLKEYEGFKFFLQRKSALTNQDIAELEKNTGKKAIFVHKQ